jgi:hypothetical protein
MQSEQFFRAGSGFPNFLDQVGACLGEFGIARRGPTDAGSFTFLLSVSCWAIDQKYRYRDQ